MNILVFNPLAVLTFITFVSMVLLIGGQYKSFLKRTNKRNNMLPYPEQGNLQLSACCNESMTEEKKCPKHLKDFSGGTLGI